MAVRKKGSTKNEHQQKHSEEQKADPLNTSGLLNNAQKVVNAAIGVLEEEIAAGILAAKKIEKKVINVEEVRGNDQDLINRIRHDMHEALDIFIDGFAALSKQIGLLTEKVNGGKETSTPTSPTSPEFHDRIQHIRLEEACSPGQHARFSFELQDDEHQKETVLHLFTTGFSGISGYTIFPDKIHIHPTMIKILPGKVCPVTVDLDIPDNCPPGLYHALMLIKEMPETKIMLTLDIK